MNKKKLLYKNLGSMIGNFLDTLFFTDFGKRARNYYYQYNQNDYIFGKNEYYFVHVPRTGGWSFRRSYELHKLPFHVNQKKSHHNPVSLLCPPNEYKYVTVIRDPVQRVRSHFQMFQHAKEISVSKGLINFLRYSYEVKNLYCQYYSGLIGEVVDERIYNIALKNLKSFNTVINFENYDEEVKKFFEKFEIKGFDKRFYDNKSPEKTLEVSEEEAIRIYNYWDLKLYDEIINFKINNNKN